MFCFGVIDCDRILNKSIKICIINDLQQFFLLKMYDLRQKLHIKYFYVRGINFEKKDKPSKGLEKSGEKDGSATYSRRTLY